jgi:hypothetical protein
LIETVGDGEVALVQAVLGLRGAGVEEGVAHGIWMGGDVQG